MSRRTLLTGERESGLDSQSKEETSSRLTANGLGSRYKTENMEDIESLILHQALLTHLVPHPETYPPVRSRSQPVTMITDPAELFEASKVTALNNGQPLYDMEKLGRELQQPHAAFWSLQGWLERQKTWPKPELVVEYSRMPIFRENCIRNPLPDIPKVWDEYKEKFLNNPEQKALEVIKLEIEQAMKWPYAPSKIFLIGLPSFHGEKYTRTTLRQHLFAFNIVQATISALLARYQGTRGETVPQIFIDSTHFNRECDKDFIEGVYRSDNGAWTLELGNLAQLLHLCQNRSNFFVMLRPHNPVRQMLAQLLDCANTSTIPPLVLCSPWQVDNTGWLYALFEGDRTSDTVYSWLSKYIPKQIGCGEQQEEIIEIFGDFCLHIRKDLEPSKQSSATSRKQSSRMKISSIVNSPPSGTTLNSTSRHSGGSRRPSEERSYPLVERLFLPQPSEPNAI